jgi:RNA-directed DNA polymerase
MLDALTGRTRVTSAALPRPRQHDAGAGHERRSAAEPSPLWSNVPYVINVLPLKTKVKHPVPCSPALDCPFELEITFCVRGVISPLLANLFLHYTFDLWMLRKWKHLPFERYADDIIVHCRGKWEANLVRAGVENRLRECGLELHSEKTKLVYCKDSNRQERHPHEKFDFLGFTFRPRKAITRKGVHFCSFSPAISTDAKGKIGDEIRSWKLHLRTAQSIAELAKEINPKLRGWFNYYGRFNPSALRPIERHVGQSLVRWACRKYKTLRRHRRRAWEWLLRVIDRQPDLLALWEQQRRAVSTIGAV